MPACLPAWHGEGRLGLAPCPPALPSSFLPGSSSTRCQLPGGLFLPASQVVSAWRETGLPPAHVPVLQAGRQKPSTSLLSLAGRLVWQQFFRLAGGSLTTRWLSALPCCPLPQLPGMEVPATPLSFQVPALLSLSLSGQVALPRRLPAGSWARLAGKGAWLPFLRVHAYRAC